MCGRQRALQPCLVLEGGAQLARLRRRVLGDKVVNGHEAAAHAHQQAAVDDHQVDLARAEHEDITLTGLDDVHRHLALARHELLRRCIRRTLRARGGAVRLALRRSSVLGPAGAAGLLAASGTVSRVGSSLWMSSISVSSFFHALFRRAPGGGA